MEPNLDAQLLNRMLQAEEDLLDLISDQRTLSVFTDDWLSLTNDVYDGLKTDTLSLPTISTAHDLAQHVPTILHAVSELEIFSERMMATLDLETSAILDTASGGESHSLASPRRKSSTKSLRKRASYIETAYEWLLANLHDPYPRASMRDDFANRSGRSRTDVDNWFIDMRERIGWNALRKSRFSNKRANIVDAARCYFDKHVHGADHCISKTLSREFVRIQVNARSVYYTKFHDSPLAARLDAEVRDLTPELKALSKASRTRVNKAEKNSDSLLSLSLPVRREAGTISSESTNIHPYVEPVVSMDVPPSINRKRRSSDSSKTAVKRPRHLLSGPRPHAVSDPLFSFDFLLHDTAKWFMDPVSPACASQSHRLTGKLDVALGDLSVFENNGEIASLPFSESDMSNSNISNIPSPLQSYRHISPEQDALKDATLDTDLSQLFSNSALDEILANVSLPSPNSFVLETDDFPALTHFREGNPDIIPGPDTAVIVDPSPPASLHPDSNVEIDWPYASFAGMSSWNFITQMPDSVDMLTKTLPTMPASPFINTSRDQPQTERNVKLQQLLEMKEAARKLEEELACCPIVQT